MFYYNFSYLFCIFLFLWKCYLKPDYDRYPNIESIMMVFTLEYWGNRNQNIRCEKLLKHSLGLNLHS